MDGSSRLAILFVTRLPPSPPRFGAQARLHGLLTALARRHDLSVLSLHGPGDDAGAARRALEGYCREVVLVPGHPGSSGLAKRWLQLRSLASPRSYEHLLHRLPALQAAADALLSRTRFDVVDLEFPFMTGLGLRRAPDGAPAPRVILGEHNVEWSLGRQVAARERGTVRRLYAAADWRKLRAEEEGAWRSHDGVTVCSEPDADRVRAAAPAARVAVVPNAVDLERLRPRADHPPAVADRVLFFGSMGYAPNVDAVLHLLDRIWPAVRAARPAARLEIVGPGAPPAVLARRAPDVEVTGFVDDLAPHLARAAVVVAPLRMGGGTRLKILEAMAMARPVVSTPLGAEGIEARHGVELLLADEPAAFAAAVARLLADPAQGDRLGRAGRALVEERYSWGASADRWERFARELLGGAGA